MNVAASPARHSAVLRLQGKQQFLPAKDNWYSGRGRNRNKKKQQRYIRYAEESTSPDAALAAHCDCESWDSLRASKSTTRPVDFCGCLEFDEDASFHRKWDLGRGDVASCPATEIFIPATAFPTKLNAFSHNELEGDTSLIPKSLVDQVSA